MLVGRLYEVAQEFVHELLGEGARLHVGFHVDVLHEEAGIFEHGLQGDDVRVNLAPGERLDGGVHIVGACACHLQHGCHGEAGTRVSVVLNLDMRIFVLDALHEASEGCGTAYARHVLEADFIAAVFHQVVYDAHVVFYRVNGGGGDAQRSLGDHAGLLGAQDGCLEVAVVVEAAEGTGDIHALRLLDLVHQVADIFRNRIHAKAVQCAFQHVGLDAGLAERCGPCADRLVRVLPVEELDLLESAAVGLYAVETAHRHDDRGDLFQLVDPGGILAGGLPHVAVDQGEFNFSTHKNICD